MRKKEQLRPTQLFAVEWILKNEKCAPWLGMGMGKTAAALTAIDILMFHELDIRNVLVVGTKNIVETVWEQEAKQEWEHLKHFTFSRIHGSEKERKAALKQKAHIYLVSRDNIAWLCGQFGGKRLPFDMLVLDEATAFKNRKSLRWKALSLVTPAFRRVVELTGTPSPKGLIDLWSQLYLLDQGARLGRTEAEFRGEYFGLQLRKETGRNKPLAPYRELRSADEHGMYRIQMRDDAEQRIFEKISDICYSMKTHDHVAMPERIDNIIRLRLPEEIWKEYKCFEREKVIDLSEKWHAKRIEKEAIAAQKAKLLEGCTDYYIRKVKNFTEDAKWEALGMVSTTSEDALAEYEKTKRKLTEQYETMSLEERIEYMGNTPGAITAANAAGLRAKLLQFCNGAVYDESGKNYEVFHAVKVEAAKEIVEQLQGEPLLIAWSYKHDRDRLMQALKAEKPRELRENGTTLEAQTDWNDRKISVLLTHPASAAHGLNIQKGGHNLLWFGVTDDVEIEQQLDARLIRPGQPSAHVVVHRLIVEGSIEEDVIARNGDKADTQQRLMEATRKLILQYSKK